MPHQPVRDVCNRQALIDRYAEFLDWKMLSENPALPWSEDLLEHYAGHWDWQKLSRNKALPWSEDIYFS